MMKKILKEFSYIPNTAYLHQDTNLMPNKKVHGQVGTQSHKKT